MPTNIKKTDAAKELGVTSRTIERWIKKATINPLKTFMVAGTRRIELSEWERVKTEIYKSNF